MRSISMATRGLVCFALCIPLVLLGCASTERAAAIPYQVELLADANVNPDIKNRPSPIVIRVFELRADAAFEASSFFSLQDKPEQVLGQEMIATDRIIMRPGEKKLFNRPGSVDARSIGLIAEYRDLEANRWRKVIPLPPPKQLNLYKFWQTSPDQLKVRVAIKNGGIDLLPVAK